MRNFFRAKTTPLTPGMEAERWARHYLEQQGLATLEQNYRTTRGEIDLIMQHGSTLVFVEVRLRRHPGFASAAQSIDAAKQRRIVATARHYLQHKHLWEKMPCRFDALCLGKDHGNNAAYQVEWLQNAFSLS
ncbi:YraN family protein [Porticoccus sp.]